MITLRDYQNQIIDGVRRSLGAGNTSPLVVSPTGSGKTVMFAYISANAAQKRKSVMILVHRQELLEQTCKTLRAFGVDHGVVIAGRTPDRRQFVQVASVQTLVRRLDQYKPDLIIVDEAHHGVAGSWRRVIENYPNAKVLGFTATPERLDGKGLGDSFDDLIMGPSVSWLIDQGHLSKPVYYAPPQVADASNLRKRCGDFKQEEIAEIMDKPAIIGDAVSHYARICPHVPAVAFCASIAHATHVAQAFTDAGFRSEVIDGTLSREIRRQRVTDLGNGKLDVLTSCDIINEGFDLPVVSAAILLRHTASLGLHLQQIGRVLRPCDGKDRAVILDHVGNLGRHGFAEDDRDWSLEGRAKRSKQKSEADITQRQCTECFCCHPPAPVCPECGHEYPVRSREIEVIDGQLEEINIEQARNKRKKEQAMARTVQDLIVLGQSKGYKNAHAWARHVMAGRLNKR